VVGPDTTMETRARARGTGLGASPWSAAGTGALSEERTPTWSLTRKVTVGVFPAWKSLTPVTCTDGWL